MTARTTPSGETDPLLRDLASLVCLSAVAAATQLWIGPLLAVTVACLGGTGYAFRFPHSPLAAPLLLSSALGLAVLSFAVTLSWVGPEGLLWVFFPLAGVARGLSHGVFKQRAWLAGRI